MRNKILSLPLYGHILLFVLVLFSASYLTFEGLVSEADGREFVFNNFLIYNFALKVLLYFFKFIFFLFVWQSYFHLIPAKISFRDTLKAVIFCELVFFLPDFLKIFWFFFIQTDYDAADLTGFLSYSSIAGILEIGSESLLYGFLDLIDIFQILYILLLGSLLSRLREEDSFLAVLLIYSVLQITYVLIVTFFSVISG